jgi:hypothetical protein
MHRGRLRGRLKTTNWAAGPLFRHNALMIERRMIERRTRRSSSRDEALQLLVETIAERGGGRGVALVDDRGLLLAGAGRTREMWGLARCVSRIDSLAPAERPALAHVAGADERLRLAAYDLAGDELANAARSVRRILCA